jgi:ornithine carbamoyltransferase
LDFELHLAVPENFRPPEDVLSWAAERDAKIVFSNSPEAAVDQAIAVNTDCWVSMSDNPEEAAARAKAFEPYRVTEALMNLSDNGVFLHCLPAYRGNEVEASVIDGPQSVVFDEAENRNHIQKAILLWCFEG